MHRVTWTILMHASFGTVELIFTFVEGSAARYAYFIDKQKEFNPHQVPLYLIGLSETRWNCSASSLRRVLNEVVSTVLSPLLIMFLRQQVTLMSEELLSVC